MRSTRRPPARVTLVVLLAAVLGLALSGVPGTFASFTDTASIESGTFTPGKVQPVTNQGCTDPSGDSALVQWRNVDVRYVYRVEIVESGKVVGSAVVANNQVAGSTQQLEVAPGQLGVAGYPVSTRRDYTARIVPTIAAWTGPAVDVPFFVDDYWYLLLVPYARCP